ncbi:hypothetical protein [Chryseobacterium sp.]|uniref:hypothetical protein n=1 Tax=Chryseobacterium sp. TaxID=1871047 RepID=UPI000EB99E1B|nr:hypothetical protein [Chryseobacterium sp.]HCM33719.1 hypothetical protein [Chryseobacterium sp.]
MKGEVKFKRRIFNIDNQPFELWINKSIIDDTQKSDFSWCWRIDLKKFDDIENDEENLQQLMVAIIQRIMKVATIKITGITLHKNIYEIIFYAKEDDTTKIATEFVEIPHEIEDREKRFIGYHSKRDQNWEYVKMYFEAMTRK